jgi:glutamine amidotransferase
MKVAIIKYGMGNVASVEKTVKKLGHIPVLTDDHAEISAADLIILPGVGSFTKAMDNLEHAGLVKVLGEEVIEKKSRFSVSAWVCNWLPRMERNLQISKDWDGSMEK